MLGKLVQILSLSTATKVIKACPATLVIVKQKKKFEKLTALDKWLKIFCPFASL